MAKLVFHLAGPACVRVPTRSDENSLFFCILTKAWHNLVVDVICSSLMSNDVEHLFMCLLDISISSFLMYLFRSFTHLLKIFLFICLRERERKSSKCGEGEGQADFALSVEPDVGLDPMTPDHDPSQNQESDAQPTEPPRCPYSPLKCLKNLLLTDNVTLASF